MGTSLLPSSQLYSGFWSCWINYLRTWNRINEVVMCWDQGTAEVRSERGWLYSLQRECQWSVWACSLLTRAYLTGLSVLGWHRSPPELWIGTDSLSSCCQSRYLFLFAFHLIKRNKKQNGINFKYICFCCTTWNNHDRLLRGMIFTLVHKDLFSVCVRARTCSGYHLFNII